MHCAIQNRQEMDGFWLSENCPTAIRDHEKLPSPLDTQGPHPLLGKIDLLDQEGGGESSRKHLAVRTSLSTVGLF